MIIQRFVDINELTQQLTGEQIIEGMSDRWRSRVRALSKAITFLESSPRLAQNIIALASSNLTGTPETSEVVPEAGNQTCPSSSKHSRVIGLTGLPGAGKSSLTNLLVREIRRANKTVAVLAVDPSSPLSGGAVLGDRVRMQEHFKDPGVFIRSMSSRGALGGVARSTRGAIRLSGLVGFDYILVETVGIGQSESEIVELADTTILVLMPNSGDEVQLMKAGVLQLADVYVVNKSDLASPARMMNELHENTSPSDSNAWCPPIISSSAADETGIEQIIQAVEQHRVYELSHPKGFEIRKQRATREILRALQNVVEPDFLSLISGINDSLMNEVIDGRKPALAVADELAKIFLGSQK